MPDIKDTLLSPLERAFLVANKAHANQSYDLFSYMYHIEHVERILRTTGADYATCVAGVLHDTLEDCDISYNDLHKEFGVDIADMVYCVTDGEGKNRKEKKANTYPKIRSNYGATCIKIADRIANTYQSSKNNKGLFEMYKKEYPTFIKELSQIFDRDMSAYYLLWSMLNKLMED